MSSLLNVVRTRRLRSTPELRRLVRETQLDTVDLVYPLFLRHGQGVKNEVPSMPGVFQWSVDRIAEEAKTIADLGIPAVLLFGIPNSKDPIGLENFAGDGIVQRAIRAIKSAVPKLIVITDICLCEYTDHGHCGLLNLGEPLPEPNLPEGYILNDATLDVLGKVAISHAEAGADIVAPSGMIDGMVAAIRQALDQKRYQQIPILSYAIKYSSSFYGPFRDAADSSPSFGDRHSHQMDSANTHEALREARIDLDEGADMLMVKPALPYMDVIYRVKQSYQEIPLAVYNVSGEYAMIKAASNNGWLDEERAVLELLSGLKRAGADFIITYHAKDAARWIEENKEPGKT